jgi:hypothetical protein
MSSSIFRVRGYGVRRGSDGWDILDIDVSGDRGDTAIIKRDVVATAPTEQEAERMARRLILGLPKSDVIDAFFGEDRDFSGHQFVGHAARSLPAILERLHAANRLRAATPIRHKKARSA